MSADAPTVADDLNLHGVSFEVDGQRINPKRVRVHTAPLKIRLPCPVCREIHVDDGIWATKPHHTHACQYCGNVWRPAVENTTGVRFLPDFKNP